MTKVTLSPKFQIVIPKEIREKLKLRPGQQIVLMEQGGIITAIPEKPIKSYRGILGDMSLEGLREKKDRF